MLRQQAGQPNTNLAKPFAGEGEDELHQAQARLEFLLTASPIVIYSDRPSPGYPTNFISPNVLGMLGYTTTEVRQPGWFEDHLHPDDREQMDASLAEIMSAGTTLHEYRLRHADGRYRWIRDRSRLIRDIGGEAMEIVGSLEDVTDLRQADARFRAMADAAAQGIWLEDPVEGLTYANPAELAIMGLTWAEAKGHGWQRSVHPDDRERQLERWNETVAHGGPWTASGRFLHRDGRVVEFTSWAAPIHDEQGQVVSYVGQTTDVTDQRRDELALQQSEARFRELVTNLEVGFWTFDPADGVIRYVSPGYERMFGLTLEDFTDDAWAWLEHIHPDDRDSVRSRVESSEGTLDIQYRFRRPGGDWRWARGRSFAVRDEDGEVRLIAGIATDITSEQAAQEELRKSNEFMAALLDASPAIIAGLDAEGRVTLWNAAAERILGWTADEVVGNPVPQLFEDGEVSFEWPPRAITNLELQPRTKAGARVDVNVSVAPLTDASGAVIGGVGVALDVTEHKRTEAERARIMAVLDEDARARAELNAVVNRLIARVEPGRETAAVCDELLSLPAVTVAAVLVFEQDGSAETIAYSGPAEAPVGVGKSVPATRAKYIRERAAQSSWVEDWRPRDEDGEYGVQWAKAGLRAVAYLPMHAHGELAGALIVGTTDETMNHQLATQLPELQEFGAVAAALLAPVLQERMRHGRARSEIDEIIQADAFQPVFQPVIDLAGSSVVGYEALTRFADGTAPDVVFARAETVGRGHALEAATLSKAMRATAALPSGSWLSVNVSPALATRPDLLGPLLQEADRQIVIEITERTPIDNYEAVQRAITSLGRNVRLAVDDAGAGFASLRHIVELRPHFVKLDVGLVRGISRDPARQALVAGMVYYAGEAGCALIAEGIEDEDERRVVRRLGVTFGQGYLLGRPAPALSFSRPAPSAAARDARPVAAA